MLMMSCLRLKFPAASYEADNVGNLLNKVLAPGGFSATAAGSNYVIKKIGDYAKTSYNGT